MGRFYLIGVNLGRNKRRSLLTFLSVFVALFLFCALGGILDTLDEAIQVGSETRLVTRNKISLVFPMPMAYRERIASVPGVDRVAVQNWFGGQDPADPRNFFAQFAVDPENFFPMYAPDMEIVAATPPQTDVALPDGMDPKLAAFALDRTGCVVGQRLFERMKWKLGQTITLSGTIYPGNWPLTIHAVYHARNKAFGEEMLFFHFAYLDEKGMGGSSQVGVYVLELADPGRASSVVRTVDGLFENSAAATRTESERAFQAGFVSMYGNVPFVIRVIGLAVAFAILLIAANTMMMAFRERVNEFGVMKTLGFADSTVFGLVLAEAAILTLLGGAAGALLAKFAIDTSNFNAGGMLPPMVVRWSTVATGIMVAAVIGAVSGLIPAWQASRLKIVDALRRVE